MTWNMNLSPIPCDKERIEMAYVKNFPQDEVVGLAGQVKVRAGEERVVHAGEALVMPAKVPHSLHADQSFKMLLTVVFPR